MLQKAHTLVRLKTNLQETDRRWAVMEQVARNKMDPIHQPAALADLPLLAKTNGKLHEGFGREIGELGDTFLVAHLKRMQSDPLGILKAIDIDAPPETAAELTERMYQQWKAMR